MFYNAMAPYASTIIQPEGQALMRSYKLERPIFTLRTMPVKEQYKRAIDKVTEALYPGSIPKKEKIEQSIGNIILNNKGTLLDIQKQMTEVKLKIALKGRKDIKESDSTKVQKLELDKKILETDEERAIFKMLLNIKKESD